MNYLAPKLIQHVIASESIKKIDTSSYFAINLVNFLSPRLIQHEQSCANKYRKFLGLNLRIFHNVKLKIHSVIQHILKLADLQSTKGASLNKC